MKNETPVLVTTLRNLLFLSAILLTTSCEEWTPEADGYFTIDGKRYDVHIMVIDKEAFASPSTYNNTHVVLQGAPYVNVSMFVFTSSMTLSEGSYHLSYGYEPQGINSLSLRYGNATSSIGAGQNSEGNMTVAVSGNNYALDFHGNIEGRSVRIHYSGLVSQR